jgi:hypothetical protein
MGQGKAKWMAWALLALGLALPAAGQSVEGARLVTASRRTKHAKAKAGPAVSRTQLELAHEMADDAYALGRGLDLRERVALLTRLLYTMSPEVMAEEKKEWAEELFGLAQKLPAESERSVDARSVDTRSVDTRNQAIATAAARVAVYDSERALELLDTLASEGGRREDARTMASRLVFAIYMQHHSAAGAQTLLAHGRKWGEHGGFPYDASAAALARLREDEDAAEDFFRQTLAVFERGQEGVFGVREFAGLLERAVVLEAISEESAEEAGRAVVAQLGKLVGIESAGSEVLVGKAEGDAAGNASTGNDAAGKDSASKNGAGAAPIDVAVQRAALTEEEKRQGMEALNVVRLSAPKAYAQAGKEWPGLFALLAEPSGNAALPAAGAGASGNAALPAAGAGAVQALKVDAGLEASFGELEEAIRERRGPEALHEVIARGLQRVDARYIDRNKAGGCAECVRPDAQSWALVSLAAYAAPMTIAAQLKEIEEPFWHAYFLAIAAQQVGEPTRVADPTARRVAGKEEAEPE